MREGLRPLEQRCREDGLKLRAFRGAIDVGLNDEIHGRTLSAQDNEPGASPAGPRQDHVRRPVGVQPTIDLPLRAREVQQLRLQGMIKSLPSHSRAASLDSWSGPQLVPLSGIRRRQSPP